MMPTLREMTGASEDDLTGMDGVSLIPELTGNEGQKEHEYLYFEFQELGGRQAVRKGDWKLVHMNIRATTTGTSSTISARIPVRPVTSSAPGRRSSRNSKP